MVVFQNQVILMLVISGVGVGLNDSAQVTRLKSRFKYQCRVFVRLLDVERFKRWEVSVYFFGLRLSGGLVFRESASHPERHVLGAVVVRLS